MIVTWGVKVAIVTGAASGIGRGLAEAMALRGTTVIVADINNAGAVDVAAGIVARGGKAEACKVNVADAQAVQVMVDEVISTHGRLDFMVNNAGIGMIGDTRDMSLSDWQHVLDINLMGVIHGVAAAYPRMVAQESGHILNTASMAGLVPLPGSVAYTTAKHAVVGMSLALRCEAAHLGVRVSAICPGFIDTSIYESARYLREGVTGRDVRDMIPFKMDSIQECAQQIMRGVERNDPLILVTRHAHWLGLLHRLFPRLSLWISQRRYERGLAHRLERDV